MGIVPVKEWQWFGSPGHFICAGSCRFHLCTLVGRYLVSTVGELWPERAVREIHAQYNAPKWLEQNRHLKGDYFDAAYMGKFGYEEIGYGRKYETMVFLAGKPCTTKDCNCGLPSLADSSELDVLPANSAKIARENHMNLCRKYAAVRP